jgi:hypothetical protein
MVLVFMNFAGDTVKYMPSNFYWLDKMGLRKSGACGWAFPQGVFALFKRRKWLDD